MFRATTVEPKDIPIMDIGKLSILKAIQTQFCVQDAKKEGGKVIYNNHIYYTYYHIYYMYDLLKLK